MSASQEAVLGTLVHRAVLMPFAKPKEMRQQKTNGPFIIDATWNRTAHTWSGETVAEAVGAAAGLLLDACNEPVGEYGDNKAWRAKLELVADAGGAWWAGPATDFRQLNDDGRAWVLRRLSPAATKVADWLSQMALKEDWKWIWSEVPLWSWATRIPTVTRVDLLVGAGPSSARGYAFDLKVTSSDYGSETFEPPEKHVDSLRRYRAGLEGTTFPGSGRTSLSLLYADREGKREPLAIDQEVARW